MIEFRHSTMVDCPETLYSGADLILSLNIYIRSSAFASPSTSGASNGKKAIFNEGQETETEQMLRERKDALAKLFEVVSLRPDTERSSQGPKRETELQHEDVLAMTQLGKNVNVENVKGKQRADAKPRTEIVGDGEEVEIDDDDGELSEGQLDVIYRK